MGKALKKCRFDELEIKARVLTELRGLGRIDRHSVLAGEYCLGRSGVRADLAIRSDRMIGVEVKSNFDSLRRLRAQLAVYRVYFDRTILVVGSRHVSALTAELVAGVEVWECGADGSINPIQEPVVLADLPEPLWSDLMNQGELKRFGDELDQLGARAAFKLAFDQRFGETSRAFWAAVARRKVKSEDLAMLSRFRDARIARAAWAADQAMKWETFTRDAQLILGAECQNNRSTEAA